MSALQMLFKQKIVCRSDVVMFISFNTSLSILDVKIELPQFLQNSFIDRNSMISYNDSTV